ncbi:hypothetical protein [Shewanella baltica]|uniref:hypothetical protein n=1 Tax=Shewanella baltica TaxID=62322 RepID=UPI0039B0C4B3
MFLIVIAFSLWFLVTFKDLLLCGYKMLLNPFFWASLFVTLYFLVPSFFVAEINNYFYWAIDPDDILLSHMLVSIFSGLLSVFYFIYSSKNILRMNSNELNNSALLVKLLWFLISSYLIFALWMSISKGAFGKAFLYNNEQTDPFKLKNIAYLLIPISTYCFWHTKRYLVFLPNLIIIVLDLVSGSRTVAMIVLIPIIISTCVHKRKLYILPGILFLAGMLLLGVLRSENVVGGVPWHINAIGEFRETYITLPLYITNSDYVGNGGLFDISANLNFGLLQPLRTEIFNNYTFAGSWMANDIARGYGLGSNLLTEAIYYGYGNMFLIIVFFILFLVLNHKLMSILPIRHSLVLICFLVVFLRLMIREGFYLNFGLLLFILCFYWLPIIYLLKVKALFKRMH